MPLSTHPSVLSNLFSSAAVCAESRMNSSREELWTRQRLLIHCSVIWVGYLSIFVKNESQPDFLNHRKYPKAVRDVVGAELGNGLGCSSTNSFLNKLAVLVSIAMKSALFPSMSQTLRNSDGVFWKIV